MHSATPQMERTPITGLTRTRPGTSSARLQSEALTGKELFSSSLRKLLPLSTFRSLEEFVEQIRARIVLTSLSIVFLLLSTGALAQYTFTTVDVPGAMETDCNGINRAGVVVGFYLDTSGLAHGFEFVNGSFKFMDVPKSQGTYPYGINDHGQAVGWYADRNFVTHGFLFTGGKLSTLDPPNSLLTNAWSLNNAGEVVGTYEDANDIHHGFTYLNGVFTSYDAPGGILTALTGINTTGAMVGYYDNSNGVLQGFALANQKFTSLNDPSGVDTVATRLNDGGEVVGYFGGTGTGPFSAFTLSGGIYNTVELSGASDTRIRGVNNAGTIVGRYTDFDGVVHGFIGTPSR